MPVGFLFYPLPLPLSLKGRGGLCISPLQKRCRRIAESSFATDQQSHSCSCRRYCDCGMRCLLLITTHGFSILKHLINKRDRHFAFKIPYYLHIQIRISSSIFILKIRDNLSHRTCYHRISYTFDKRICVSGKV